MNKRAVIYARVSYDDRKRSEGLNLDSQLEMGREYADEHGYTIVAELPEDDRGVSGADLDLPKLTEALEMARAGELDVLVTRELDRFARGLAKQLVVEQEFKRAGVDVEYVLEKYDDTPEGQLQKNVRAVIAEYEREKITQRMTRGRRNKVKDGNVLVHGKPPYGYRLVEKDSKRVLEIHEPEARIIRLVFQWYINGDEAGKPLSMRKIAAKLTRMGVPTWSDIHCTKMRKVGNRRQWYSSNINKILHREAYKGKWNYGQRNNRTNTNNPQEHWLELDVPALVSVEVWEAAQQQMRLNPAFAKRHTQHNYLMQRRLTCGKCNHAMRSSCRTSQGRVYKYYNCCSENGCTAQGRCGQPGFRVDQVDPVVWAWVSEKMSDSDELRRELENHQAEQEAANAPLRERLAVVNDLLTENRGQLERLLDLYLSGEFPREMLIERRSRLETTIAALEKERRALTVQLEERTLTNEEVQNLEEFARGVANALSLIDDGDFDAKREMIEWLDVRATLAVEDGFKVAYVTSPVLGRSGGLSIVNTTTRN
jgi:site-specific DNA recombinase